MGWLATLLFTGLLVAETNALDLTKIDRRIANEPKYETSSPEYCLLVFGPKAGTRIWLVRDGRRLHVDRNANGILGEPGERITTNTSRWGYVKQITIIADSPAKGYLRVERRSDGRYRLYFRGKTRQYVGFAKADKPRFSGRPADAPIIHFNGPLTLARYAEKVTLHTHPTSKSYRKRSLRLMVGTPGLGIGTFAASHCRCRRGKGTLVARLQFPPKTKGGEPIRQRVVLKTYG
ncbi:MAG: hypothetical protein ACE5KM_01815 [Planctomycetaceae bacterium]